MNQNLDQEYDDFLNPDVVRPRLITAAVFIASFEAFKDVIIRRVRDFFMNGYATSGESVESKYENHVLSLNKSPVYASLEWLKEMQAIDAADIETYGRVKEVRRVLAHQLFRAMASEGLPPDLEARLGEMFVLLRKIEVWWIREFEIPTNPDFDGEEILDSDINPGTCLGMYAFIETALGDIEQARTLFRSWRDKLPPARRS